MTNLLLQIGGTKLIFSIFLACGVWVVHRRVGRCAVSYPLWLLVLVALLAPAVVSLPVFPVAGSGAGGSSGVSPNEVGALLVLLWMVGTVGLLGWTLLRAVRFQRSLRKAAWVAPAELQREAAEIGRNLGMNRIPEVHTTSARVSPMVWWTGGKVRVLVPQFLLDALDRDELRAVLAHELAHARRRDYLVRWLEWLACSVFWWNPVAWWARRQLRTAEEWCCDALGVAALKSGPRSYARSLLRAIELMSEARTVRAPAFASAADRGSNPRTLRRRLEMIMTRKAGAPAPRWLRTATWIAVVCVLPFGTLYCGSADEPESATPAEDATEAPPTPLAWSDEAFLNAEAAELAAQMLAEIDIAAIRAEHGSLGAYFREGFAEMRGELSAEVEAGNMSEGTAEQFAGVTEELVDQLVARVDSRTLNPEEALNQFVYGFVRVLSVNVELENERISDEEAGRRIEALRRELRGRENKEREYAAVMEQYKEEMRRMEATMEAIARRLQSRDSVNREYAVSGVQAIPIPGIDLGLSVTHFCDENGHCQSVDSLKRGKDPRRDAAAG
ncbi:MAG: M48 family metalloprotease [Gemmatimonadetes bacterium]|nr:M48 family metalloprotease [Gemmatimonadota bacterium]